MKIIRKIGGWRYVEINGKHGWIYGEELREYYRI